MATHEDAMLLMQILQWGAMSRLEEATNTVFANGFDAASAKQSDDGVRAVLTFGEILGTFVKNNVLNKDLVLDMWAVELLWSRVGPAAKRAREQYNEPRLFENFEALASDASGSRS